FKTRARPEAGQSQYCPSEAEPPTCSWVLGEASLLPSSFRKRERVKRVPGRDRHELPAGDFIAHRRGGHVRAGLKMPQVLAAPGVEGHDVAVPDGAEEHVASCGQHAAGERALKDLEVPHGLAGCRIERLDTGRSVGLVRFGA